MNVYQVDATKNNVHKGMQCAYITQDNRCDSDPHCQKFLRANVGGMGFTDAAGPLFLENAPRVEILTSGFPCQPFSLAGKGGGTSDPRGLVVFHVLQYVQKNLPRIVILENVKGLLSTKHAEPMILILKICGG